MVHGLPQKPGTQLIPLFSVSFRIQRQKKAPSDAQIASPADYVTTYRKVWRKMA